MHSIAGAVCASFFAAREQLFVARFASLCLAVAIGTTVLRVVPASARTLSDMFFRLVRHGARRLTPDLRHHSDRCTAKRTKCGWPR